MFFDPEYQQFRVVILNRIGDIGFDYHDGDQLYEILDEEESIIDSFMSVASYDQLICVVRKKKPHIRRKAFDELRSRYAVRNIQIPDYRDFLMLQMDSEFAPESFSVLKTMSLSIINIQQISENTKLDEIKRACWDMRKKRERKTKKRTKKVLACMKKIKKREQ